MKQFLRLLLVIGASLSSTGVFSAESPASFSVSDLSFKRPKTWEWIEVTSSMRKAQLRVSEPGKKEAAEVVFFYFGPGSGGGTKANVDRWLGQFQEPKDQIKSKVEEVIVGKHKVTYVQAEGTYNSGMPGGPKTPLQNHMLLGAIVEAEQGSVFARLTGPVALAKSSQQQFRTMVESGLK